MIEPLARNADHPIPTPTRRAANPVAIGEHIDAHVAARPIKYPDVAEHRQRYAHPSRFDSSEVVYVKRMLQTGLPAGDREALAHEFFAEQVSTDETAFTEELYVRPDELRLRRSVGMHIGSHGHSHHWMSHATAQEQTCDLARSVELLELVGVDTSQGCTLAYPYGDCDETTIDAARTWDVRLQSRSNPESPTWRLTIASGFRVGIRASFRS